MKSEIPNPGSDEAIEMGCKCPVLDNDHGKGVDGIFWYSYNCKLHNVEHDSTKTKEEES